MAEGATTLSDVRAALERARNQVQQLKGKTTEITGKVVNRSASMAGAFVAGFCHERFGKMDEDSGVKIHRTNGINSGALVGALAEVGAGFGIAGEYSNVLSAAAGGPLDDAASSWGRAAQRRLAKAKSDKDKTETKPAETKVAVAV